MKNRQDTINIVIRHLFAVAGKLQRLEQRGRAFGDGIKLFPTEIHTIEAIGQHNGITATELCRIFEITKGAVSQSVAKLVEKGMVARKRNPDYGKEKILSLTAKGREVYEWHKRFHEGMDAGIAKEILENYDENRITDFIQMLQKISAHIDIYLERE